MTALDIKERRELFKAYRSAHDGLCPCCGGQVVTDNIRDTEKQYACITCNFHLTYKEVDVINSWRTDFHHNVAETLRYWRES